MSNANHPPPPPDYVAIGHVSKDLRPHPLGPSPGGTALYSALTARSLGLSAGIVTAIAPEDEGLLAAAKEAGVLVHAVDSPATTTFVNTYDSSGHRTQVLAARARALSYSDIPAGWLGAPHVHLGPVAQEIDAGMVGLIEAGLLGVTPQGWLRGWNGAGQVTQSALPVPDALLALPSAPATDIVVVLSREDLGDDPSQHLERYAALHGIVVITDGERPALVSANGEKFLVPALRARPIDPTGAGDVFAAALFIHYRETGDLRASVRFAHAAAACNIEGHGIEAIPGREQIGARLADEDNMSQHLSDG